MNLKRLIKSAAIAGLGLTLATTASLAASATTSLNVRNGPNSSYSVVDILYPGEHVNVKTCSSNGWCLINHRGPDGWVSSRYLTNSSQVFSSHHTTSKPRLRYVRPKTGITIQFGTGFGWTVQDNSPDCIRRFGKTYCR